MENLKRLIFFFLVFYLLEFEKYRKREDKGETKRKEKRGEGRRKGVEIRNQ